MPFAGKLDFPQRPGRIPIGGDALFEASAVSAWATPATPRFGRSQCKGAADQQSDGSRDFHDVGGIILILRQINVTRREDMPLRTKLTHPTLFGTKA